MKRCEDCRHSYLRRNIPWCRYLEMPQMLERAPGVGYEHEVCGPDARYFEPTFWARVKGWFKWWT
jgi:hypothetical protein